MNIQIKNSGQEIETVALQGDLDFHTSQELRTELSKLSERKAAKVLIDLKKVSYIDSSGLAAFIELFQQMKRYSGKLVLFGLAPEVRGVFEIAHLDSILKLAQDEKEALEFVSSNPRPN